MAVARRRVAVGLGVAGAACALLGVCLLVVGPIIVKDQVIKVSGAGGFWVHGSRGAALQLLGARYGAGVQPGRGAELMVRVQGGGCWSRCTFWGLVWGWCKVQG